MNLVASEPALVGVDWGTTSLRAFLIDETGKVIDSFSSSDGIMQLDGRPFEAVLQSILGRWELKNALPLVASGMITSRNGWVETPYAKIPLGAQELAQALVSHQMSDGTSIHFVTGASLENSGAPDVMRGEETQIIGASALGLGQGTFILPGTHSKWVEVENAQIIDFSTYMTGEVFAALKGCTILGAFMEDSQESPKAFEAGVRASLNNPENLLHRLFHVRTLPLMEKIPKTDTADYLSGLLIGTEIAAASRKAESLNKFTLVGRSDLSKRYETALHLAGLESRQAPVDVVAMGHFVIARAAGLLE